ncbi:hypothetical protein M1558_02130 [Candidatus Parvarchaeota archaeon]|nr:hypothetical protein [Candidatus Parvarchaeota archaeon]
MVIHKAQSALEYMMTYGWAIFIIVIVAVTLYYLGIFNPSANVTAGYSGFAGMPILSQTCLQNIGLFIIVGNSEGHLITINKINMTLQNGSTISRNVDFTVRNGEQLLIPLLNACPYTGGSTYSIKMTIDYYLPDNALQEPGVAQGTLYGIFTRNLSSAPTEVRNLFSVAYAFATPYIGVNFQTQEYYANGVFIGKVALPFPNSLSDLNNGLVDCGKPYNTQGYTAVTDVYLSSGVSFEILTNDGTTVFYRPLPGGAWTSVFGDTAWEGNSAGHFGPITEDVSPGEYELAVDWTNICSGGISALDVKGALPVSSYWNVTAWTPENSSENILPYSNITYDPANPANISVEQIGNWSSAITEDSCNSNNVCTTIFDAFQLPYGTKWWVDFDGSNVSSTSSFISFTTATGSYSYIVAQPSVNSSGCVDKYSVQSTGTLSSGSSLPLFYGESETCYTTFQEAGLPSGSSWSVLLNGVEKTELYSSNITFVNSPGYYSFSANSVSYGGSTYYPCPLSGYVAAGSIFKVQYSTSSSCNLGFATFHETGIPYGLNWSVDYNGNIKESNSSAITFLSSTGSNSFTVLYPTLEYLHTGCLINYTPSVVSGSLSTGSEQSIVFSPVYNCTSSFIEHGLPAGVLWSVKYAGIAKSSSSNIINFSTTNENSFFNSSKIVYNGNTYYPCMGNGTLPSGSQQNIYYSLQNNCMYK